MGLVWSKEVAQPTIENGTKINIDVVLGAFEISLSDLVTFTKYYYRIFAKNKYGVGYSEPMMVMFVGDKFTDPRDKNTYKIKQYGNCIWMVENFRYVPADRLNKGIWVQGYNGSSAEEAMPFTAVCTIIKQLRILLLKDGTLQLTQSGMN
jgi:hypothetical protein